MAFHRYTEKDLPVIYTSHWRVFALLEPEILWSQNYMERRRICARGYISGGLSEKGEKETQRWSTQLCQKNVGVSSRGCAELLLCRIDAWIHFTEVRNFFIYTLGGRKLKEIPMLMSGNMRCLFKLTHNRVAGVNNSYMKGWKSFAEILQNNETKEVNAFQNCYL